MATFLLFSRTAFSRSVAAFKLDSVLYLTLTADTMMEEKGERCKITLDGTDFKIKEPTPFESCVV